MALRLETEGWFYAAQLYPDVVPLAIKFGFSTKPEQRMLNHRGERSAPAVRLVRTWPARMLWERSIIGHVTQGCLQAMDSETYLLDDMDAMIGRVDAFTATHPVTKIATPPVPPVRPPHQRLIDIRQACGWYRISQKELMDRIGRGEIRAYPLRLIWEPDHLCVEEAQIVPFSLRYAPPPAPDAP